MAARTSHPSIDPTCPRSRAYSPPSLMRGPTAETMSFRAGPSFASTCSKRCGRRARRAQRSTLAPSILDSAGRGLAAQHDAEFGGFGGAPKFPQPMALEFLLRYAQRSGDEAVRDIAVHSLDKMARGGIYDQLGGGFHRYSTDAEWLVPHFGKMLYDNAQQGRADRM